MEDKILEEMNSEELAVYKECLIKELYETKTEFAYYFVKSELEFVNELLTKQSDYLER